VFDDFNKRQRFEAEQAMRWLISAGLLSARLLSASIFMLFAGVPSVECASFLGAQPANIPNTNALIKLHHPNLKFACSTYWPGWPMQRAFDGDPRTSWFTNRGDAAAKGTMPWIEVGFPVDVAVNRVTLVANREPPWEIGYTIRVGRVEFFDDAGNVLLVRSGELGGKREELEIRPAAPTGRVRRIRFTSLQDDGDKNPYDDVAIGEMLVE
jgi:hypothetical protein